MSAECRETSRLCAFHHKGVHKKRNTILTHNKINKGLMVYSEMGVL